MAWYNVEMSIEGFRPEGFPFSEEELSEARQYRMTEIVNGKYLASYSEWILRGIPKEPWNPIAAVGVFPTLAMSIDGPTLMYEPEFAVYDESSHGKLLEHWKQIAGLPYPDRVRGIEQLNYGQLVQRGDQILQQIKSSLARNLMPSAMVVFNRPDLSSQESAYLVSPTIVPPSAAYRFMLDQARQNLCVH